MITIKKRLYSKKLNENDLVLDIETTGLDFKYDKLVLLGLVKLIDGKTYIIQYFAKTDDEELRLLEIYENEVKNKRLITFNGDIFDIGFLNSRLINFEKNPIFPENTLDIYKIIKRNRKFFHYESMKLSEIEKLLGIYREDPSRYKSISKLSDKIFTRNNPYPILKHNENDLISTLALSDIKDIYKNKLSISTKLGNIYLYNANINKDIGNFEFRVESNVPDTYFVKDNYQLIIKDDFITLNLHVLFGNFNKNTKGYVAINTLGIKNHTNIDINKNLLVIKEQNIYNYKNLLNFVKKILEKYI